MAVLPASPQTATQGTPHPLSVQGQTQVLLSAAAGSQAQPQLLYQPYNLMPTSGSPSHHTAAYQYQNHHLHHHLTSAQQASFLQDPSKSTSAHAM